MTPAMTARIKSLRKNSFKFGNKLCAFFLCDVVVELKLSPFDGREVGYVSDAKGRPVRLTALERQ